MSFSISIMKDPSGGWDATQGDHHLDFDFDGIDFDELINLLNIKLPPAKRLEGESSYDYDERLKKEYFDAAKEKGYEMLGRFWFFYDDAVYLPSDVNQLSDECLKLKEKTQNPGALKALNKLITACNEALKTDSGIFFRV